MRNIRVVREAGGIGDIVRIIPALRGLREKFSDARIWVFAPAEYRVLLEGWFDEYMPTPWQGRRPRDAELDETRWPYLNVGPEFDLSVDLYCPAFRYEKQVGRALDLDRIDLFCSAAGVTPSDMTPRINLSPCDLAAAREYISAERLRAGRKFIALQPFSTDPARNWPLKNWLEIAERLEASGHDVIALDSAQGRTRGFRRRLCGRPLGFICAFIAECAMLIAPDSGLGHVAAAVGTPCLGLFASQPGAVIYKHYPLHRYVEPDRNPPQICQWPCIWARPPSCSRTALAQHGRTCEMLARIPAARVAQRALQFVEREAAQAVPCG